LSNDIDRTPAVIQALWRSGALSDESTAALQDVREISEKLSQGLGDDSNRDEVVLVAIVVDDSTSIALNMPEIRVGHELMLDALRAESFEADVQVHTRALNRGIISPYKSLSSASPLTEQNYSAQRLVPETPLYLQSLLTLGTVMVKAQQEEQRGAKVRTFTLIISDGEDNKSGKITARHVHALVTDMLDFTSNHMVAGMGVAEKVDYRHIFTSMGLPEKWVFNPGASITDLRAAFKQVARSLAIAASSETEFAAQLALGPPGSS
jgi:hypothetical protein